MCPKASFLSAFVAKLKGIAGPDGNQIPAGGADVFRRTVRIPEACVHHAGRCDQALCRWDGFPIHCLSRSQLLLGRLAGGNELRCGVEVVCTIVEIPTSN